MNNKFIIFILFVFIMSLSAVSATSDNDAVYSISNDNVSDNFYQSDADSNNFIVGNNLDENDVLSDEGLIPTKIQVISSKEGIIEDDNVILTVNITDEHNNPLNVTVNGVLNGRDLDSLETTNGLANFTISGSSGFYYFYCYYRGNTVYNSSQSNINELIFANDNTMVDLAVRIVCSDGVLNLTKDYVGYGSNSVTRRNVSDYDQILLQYSEINAGIPVNKNLLINGNGHKIDASAEMYLTRGFFYIYGCTLTLNDLELLNGYCVEGFRSVFNYVNKPTVNFNNVTLKNSLTKDISIFKVKLHETNGYIYLNVKNSKFINNTANNLFSIDLQNSNFERSSFINNSAVFMLNNWINVNIRYNIFMNNNNIFIYDRNTIYDTGYVVGNYWGTNSTSEINNIIPKANMDIIYSPGSHSFLTISGNSTFSEDNIQDYEIYFSGNYANMLPTFNTTISYTSTYSTINATSIGINGVPTTVRVSPKTYGVERLIINPDLYVLDINITKSLNNNYNVIVDAPETEYNYPLIITVNVTDKSNNIINTTADISINGTTHTINITNGIGTLEVNSLDIGTYDITTKIISNMDNYRNTTIYSTVDIIKSSSIITLACNNTTAIAREYIPFNIIAKDSKGNPVSMTVYIEEDGVKVGNVTTDENGDAIFRYKAEAGTHTYVVKVYEDKYWKSSKSNSVDIDVLSKIPAILTISSDVDYIVEENHDATIKVKLTDDKNVPIKRVEIKLFANEILVGNIFTDDNGECEFIFSNTSNIYNIKAVYDGNLTYYDNSSEINLIIAYGTSFFDLSFLINNTPENGVLNIIKNFTFDERFDKDFVNGIPINKNIVINGGNFTIDALNKSRIFNISAKNVTLDKLNIINGYAFVGGAILFSGESLTVVSSNFTNNNINMSKELQTFEELDYTGGGAIFSYGNINIINSSFKNNTLTLYSDIINKNVRYIGGGAVYTKNDLYVSNSIFDSNGVNLIKISENVPSVTLQGSNVFSTGIFTNIVNSTFKNGFSNAPIYGTVSHFNYNGFFSMNFTSFYNNYAMYCGAVNLFVVDAFISNSTFDNNTAVYGLISCTSQNALITDSFITNNVVYSHGIFLSPASNQFNVERSVIVNNKGNDTIIFEYGGDVPVNLIHNVFANNTGNTSYLISYLKYGTDRSNFNYNYWGNNTPYDSDIFNNVDNNLEYITLEIVGDNVTYTTIPTKYVIKFNGTENDQLPNFETLLEIISMFNVTVDKSSVVINGTGASVVLTSDEVQNITLIVGPEYNILAYLNITVEQLIKKNYTVDVSFSGNKYGEMLIFNVDVLDENGDGINGSLAYEFLDTINNVTIENGKAIIPLGRYDSGEYDISFVYQSTDLFYNDFVINENFNIIKSDMLFDLNVKNITYGSDEIITATPQRGVTGNFTFYIENIINETVSIEIGKASYTLKDLPSGVYTVVVTYNGDDNYNPVTLSKNFNVSRAESKIEISIDNVNYGEEIIALISGENIIGNVTVKVNNKTYSVEVANNSGKVVIDKLDVGQYDANVVYDDNLNYIGSNNSTKFNVTKASPNMSVDVGESVAGQDTIIKVSFDENIIGNVTFTVDGNIYEIPIESGVAILNLTNLTISNHELNVSYAGNNNYNSSQFNTTFSTRNVPSMITITSQNIVYGEDLVVRGFVNKNATGTIIFTINNMTKSSILNNGSAEVVFEGLYAGNYTIIANYSGDGIHISSSDSINVTVFKANSTISIDVGDIIEGENVIIKFIASNNSTGNITVFIPGLYNNRTFNLTNATYSWIISSLKSGIYTVNVVYNGDDNYLCSSNSTKIISKYHPSIQIDVNNGFIGDDYSVDVILNDTASGSVLIDVDGTEFNVTLVNGKASVNLTNLTEGQHIVEVVYSGDETYYGAESSKMFMPKNLNSTINVTSSDIIYGEDLHVKAVVSDGATGNVTFTVGNYTKTVVLENGTAETVFESIPAGNYEIVAKYSGDVEYISSTNSTSIKISKANSFILIEVGEIEDGKNVVIKFVGPSDAKGNINVSIPGLYGNRTFNLNKGAYTWTISPLKSGVYTVDVVYYGDDNYLESHNSTEIVSKYYPSFDIVVSDVLVGDDYSVDVILNDTASGSVLIDVDGAEFNVTLVNGRASVNLTKLTPGEHVVNVIYSGDAMFYNATKSMSFIPKISLSSINITASDVVYGEDLIVRAVLSEGATGHVEFTLNGVTKLADIVNNSAESSFTGLKVGEYNVTASYSGDVVYVGSSNSTGVNVYKAQSHVLINVSEIVSGENVVIRFICPDDAVGNINVSIPGLYSNRTFNLNKGIYTWTITPLKSGTYILKVDYNGDDNYLASSNSTTLISRYYPTINIDVSESIIGKNSTVTVSLPNNASGRVLITVDDIKYNKSLETAKTSVVISNITKGTHNISVEYSGDKYYYPGNNFTSFEPKSLNSTIMVVTKDIGFGEDLIVRAIVDIDATGTVTFTANNESKTVNVHDGFASATFTNLNAGEYDVKAAYSGNDVYLSSFNMTKAKVSKVNSTILINVGEIEEGKNVVINIIASKSASGNITLEIPGLYSSRIRSLANNQYTWTIMPLSAGLYNVKVVYDGDKNYYASSNSTYIDYNRIKTSLNVEAVTSKNNVRLTANLTAENGQKITAWVNTTVNGTVYRIPVINGTGFLNLGKLDGGVYEYSAFYAGSKVIVNSTDNGTFTVIPVEPILNVPDVIKYYRGSERLNIYLKDNYGDSIVNATLIISINGVKYTRVTDNNGTTSLPLNLNAGKYQVTVFVNKTAEFDGFDIVANVTILPTVNGTDLVKVFRNGTQYYATFRDNGANYLTEGTYVQFNINGVIYDRTIEGNKGLSKLNINLNQGKYIITAINLKTGEQTSNVITVIPKIIENHDIVKYFRNATQFTVKIIGDDGNPVGEGENVTFNINGVFYTRTTDNDGIAKLNINLDPGEYIITSEYGGCKVSNLVKVLPVLTANDLTKKYGTPGQFIVNLVDGKGSPYPNQNILFNINGVFYNRVTDSEGCAKLNINLISGEYIITSSYDHAIISNKVTVTS